MNGLFDVNLIKDDKKKQHTNLYKQRLNVKQIQNKFLNLIKLLFPWKYRFAFHSVPICLVPSTVMSRIEYRIVAYLQYRDGQVPSCPDTISGAVRQSTGAIYDSK